MSFGDSPIDKGQIKLLGCALERRGNHATGVCYMKDTQIEVCKAPLPAWKFFASDEYEEFEKNMPDDVDIVMVHTRLATQGSPHKNVNNHPMFAGKSAVIHNGMVTNDDFLFRNTSFPRLAETDSDIIRAFVDEHGLTPKTVEELNRMSGSVAAAIVHPEFPRKLMLVRSGSPLVLGWSSARKHLMWASEKDMLHTASRMPIQVLNTYFQSTKTDLAFQTVMKDTAYIFSKEAGGVEWHGKFSTSNYYTAPNYRVWENYNESMTKKWGTVMPKEARRFERKDGTKWIVCRNPSCSRPLKMTKELDSTPLWDLHCSYCKTDLAEEPKKLVS